MTDQTIIGAVTLHDDRPTHLTFDDLHSWVIWQFPRPRQEGFCGAVRPALPGHGWFPALIDGNEEKVLVHGHVEKTFKTPEAAVEWFNDQKKG